MRSHDRNKHFNNESPSYCWLDVYICVVDMPRILVGRGEGWDNGLLGLGMKGWKDGIGLTLVTQTSAFYIFLQLQVGGQRS